MEGKRQPDMEIVIEDLDYVYNPGTPLEVQALRNISFDIPSGTILGILGAAASGKTTLLKILNGLLTPTAGRVLMAGRDIRTFKAGLRRKVGLVFQQPERQVFEKTVFRDISFVLKLFSDLPDAIIQERVRQASDLVGLDIETLAERSPWTLSKGEMRLTAIAGVLANQPEVLILDEPTVGLGPESVTKLVTLIRRMKTHKRQTVILVSHNMDPFLSDVDKILVLHQGCLAAHGTPAEVCNIIGNDPNMRLLLPEIALLIHDLQKQGIPVPADNYSIPVLARTLVALMNRENRNT
ncbi:MAG: energy-coupling factor transport system ATP-binding protein [Thermodesulfobacteriota bacterium]|nr:energy-coupling factor transport system ATP-binding protein [Thermodesulfobacteriota bacterium]